MPTTMCLLPPSPKHCLPSPSIAPHLLSSRHSHRSSSSLRRSCISLRPPKCRACLGGGAMPFSRSASGSLTFSCWAPVWGASVELARVQLPATAYQYTLPCMAHPNQVFPLFTSVSITSTTHTCKHWAIWPNRRMSAWRMVHGAWLPGVKRATIQSPLPTPPSICSHVFANLLM